MSTPALSGSPPSPDGADERALGGNRAPYDGMVYLVENFLGPADAHAVFHELQNDLDWQAETIVIAGKRVLVPRRVCWYGDRGARYRYSGVDHEPAPWTPTLACLRDAVQSLTRCPFNSVLGNLYRNGSDALGWHADKEKELGTNPTIASLSLGAARRFILRHNKTRERVELTLTSGSLLLMAGRLQHHWRHCVPKAPEVSAARINLSFRLIVGP